MLWYQRRFPGPFGIGAGQLDGYRREVGERGWGSGDDCRDGRSRENARCPLQLWSLRRHLRDYVPYPEAVNSFLQLQVVRAGPASWPRRVVRRGRRSSGAPPTVFQPHRRGAARPFRERAYFQVFSTQALPSRQALGERSQLLRDVVAVQLVLSYPGQPDRLFPRRDFAVGRVQGASLRLDDRLQVRPQALLRLYVLGRTSEPLGRLHPGVHSLL